MKRTSNKLANLAQDRIDFTNGTRDYQLNLPYPNFFSPSYEAGRHQAANKRHMYKIIKAKKTRLH